MLEFVEAWIAIGALFIDTVHAGKALYLATGESVGSCGSDILY